MLETATVDNLGRVFVECSNSIRRRLRDARIVIATRAPDDEEVHRLWRARARVRRVLRSDVTALGGLFTPRKFARAQFSRSSFFAASLIRLSSSDTNRRDGCAMFKVVAGVVTESFCERLTRKPAKISLIRGIAARSNLRLRS